MIVGVVKETFPGERRVALVPAALRSLVGAGLEVLVESGAGDEAGFPDEAYREKGAGISDRGAIFEQAGMVCQVRTLGANPKAGRADLDLVRRDQVLIGHAEPLTDAEPAQALAERGAVLFGMELMPRITRAQTMDVLSSQATIAGYKAVLMAAEHLPRMFAMMMTAAGTVPAAHVFVIGAGVAGLQAIATARRLGGVVKAYDIRPAVKGEVQSLGAKFVELELEAGESEDKGGYAKAMDEEFYRKQRELMAHTLTETHAVITTAAVPGKKAPVLVTEDMVKDMPSGSVIVDLAAERGGNCELTRADETVVAHGVTVLGPTNLPSTVPYHASQMYSKNIQTFVLELVKEGGLNFDMENEVIKETMITRDGQVVHERVREMLNADTPQTAAVSAEGSTD
ncbi:MAG: Re/Si-specific NAD(P)(+) transhydrogenase subunit alpha [Planctomycetota bacterium]|jgi:NAD(P) transhydrogenase subunit alpha